MMEAPRFPTALLALLFVAPLATSCAHRTSDPHAGAPSSPIDASASGNASTPPLSLEVPNRAAPLEALVLAWSLDDAERGSELMEIHGDGSAQVVLRDPHGYRHRGAPSYERAALDALAVELRAADVCALRPAWPLAPNEAAATMQVRLPGLACEVTLPRRQWDEHPAARRSSAWVRDARARIHDR
jgi:hypothetical protein